MPDLDESLRAFLLSPYPPGAEILSASSYRPGYLEFPMRVEVQVPTGEVECCVAKLDEQAESIQREALALKALGQIGLPVPNVLAGPVELPGTDWSRTAVFISELPGEPLPWCGLTSLSEADLTCRLLIQGVSHLHRLTDQVRAHEVASALPSATLAMELEEVRSHREVWAEDTLFAEAIGLLSIIIPEIETPLVFSNGDYNPLNFLHQGETLTGWIDFAGACFEDPHIGFAKFLLWAPDEFGWGAGKKAGLVERWLYEKGISRREFAPRLALRCLSHLLEPTQSRRAQSGSFLRGLLEETVAFM